MQCPVEDNQAPPSDNSVGSHHPATSSGGNTQPAAGYIHLPVHSQPDHQSQARQVSYEEMAAQGPHYLSSSGSSHPSSPSQNSYHQPPPSAGHSPTTSRPPSQPTPTPPQSPQPVTLSHAASYLNKIKNRFQNQPEVYEQYLDILRTYQKEQRSLMEGLSLPPGTKPLTEAEVYSKIVELFHDHKDLLQGFQQFLPRANCAAFTLKPKLCGTLKDATVAEAGNYGTLNEFGFFDRVRKILRNPEDYDNFIRCLLFFNQELISREELVHLVTPFQEEFPELNNWFRDFLVYKETGSLPEPMPSRVSGESAMEIGPAVPLTFQSRGCQAPPSYHLSDNSVGPHHIAPSGGNAQPSAGSMQLPENSQPVRQSQARQVSYEEMVAQVQIALSNPDVYENFISCLMLFNQEIISREELVQLVTPLLEDFPDLNKWFRDFVGYKETGSLSEPIPSRVASQERVPRELAMEIATTLQSFLPQWLARKP